MTEEYAARLQELLDQEANLSNQGKNLEREPVLVMIRLMRGDETPPCFGLDDCSTSILSRCAWRMDCGSTY